MKRIFIYLLACLLLLSVLSCKNPLVESEDDDAQEKNKVAEPVVTVVDKEKPWLLLHEIQITSETEGAKILYTTNDSIPVSEEDENTFVFSNDTNMRVPLGFNTIIRAVAKKEGMEDSNIVTFSYTRPTMPMEKVDGGKFVIGGGEIGSDFDEAPARQVQLSSFFLGTTEVTQWQWHIVMKFGGDYNDQYNGSGAHSTQEHGWGYNHPVYNVSWYDAILFCNQLSINESLEPVYYIGDVYPETPNIDRKTILNQAPNFDYKKSGYRLPTEAEWDYAAGGGENNRTNYSGVNIVNGSGYNDEGKFIGLEIDSITGAQLNDYAWYTGSGVTGSQEVASKKPNILGLYDMSGNVYEMCFDWYNSDGYIDGYVDGLNINPVGPIDSLDTTRGYLNNGPVTRGGAWNSMPVYVRVANRAKQSEVREFRTGFRVARNAN